MLHASKQWKQIFNTCTKVIKAKYKIVTMRTVEVEKVRVYIKTKVTN